MNGSNNDYSNDNDNDKNNDDNDNHDNNTINNILIVVSDVYHNGGIHTKPACFKHNESY